MKKQKSNFALSWEIIVILFISNIFVFIFILSPFDHLKDLIDKSTFGWLFFFYIPCLLALFYTIVWRRFLVRSYFKIEFQDWYRYILFISTMVGLSLLALVIISKVKIPSTLLVLDRINITTKNFSYLFYIKMVIIAPILEEIIFRGYILNGFLTRYNSYLAIGLSSIFFAFFHFNLYQFIYTFFLGFFCGWYFYRTKNLLSCIFIHSIFNFLGISVFKYFFDKVKYQVINTDTKIFNIEHPWLVLFISLCLITVSVYLLNISVKRIHSINKEA